MKILNSAAKLMLLGTALPLAVAKDVVDNSSLKEHLPLTADLVDEIFGGVEDIFSNVEDTIDHIL